MDQVKNEQLDLTNEMNQLKIEQQLNTNDLVKQAPVMASMSDDNLNCSVCKKVQHKYKCPKCDILYCSKPCYTIHNSGKCSEEFSKQNIEEQLKSTKITEKTKINQM